MEKNMEEIKKILADVGTPTHPVSYKIGGLIRAIELLVTMLEEMNKEDSR